MILLAAFGFLLGCQQTAVPPPTGPVLAGDFSVVDSIFAAQENQWILLNVWATWCRPCVAETPELVAFAQSMADRPFTLVGLSTDYFTVDDTTALRKSPYIPDKTRDPLSQCGVHRHAG